MDDAQDGDDRIPVMLQSRAAASDAKLRKMAAAVRTLLECIGEDPDREGLRETPLRCADALLSLTKGYGMRISTVVNNAIFREHDHGDMVIVKDIAFHSLCEHHLVPFSGKVHIGYMPGDGRIIGLSKLARIVEVFARRLQVQERLTDKIAWGVAEVVPGGNVAVAVEASHMCMAMRGVEKTGTTTITMAWRGQFSLTHFDRRREFLNIIGVGGK